MAALDLSEMKDSRITVQNSRLASDHPVGCPFMIEDVANTSVHILNNEVEMSGGRYGIYVTGNAENPPESLITGNRIKGSGVCGINLFAAQ